MVQVVWKAQSWGMPWWVPAAGWFGAQQVTLEGPNGVVAWRVDIVCGPTAGRGVAALAFVLSGAPASATCCQYALLSTAACPQVSLLVCAVWLRPQRDLPCVPASCVVCVGTGGLLLGVVGALFLWGPFATDELYECWTCVLWQVPVVSSCPNSSLRRAQHSPSCTQQQLEGVVCVARVPEVWGPSMCSATCTACPGCCCRREHVLVLCVRSLPKRQ